jgi:hypothetical protein
VTRFKCNSHTHVPRQGWFKPSHRNIVVPTSRVAEFQSVTWDPVLRFNFWETHRMGLQCYGVTVSEGGDREWRGDRRAEA